VAGGTYQEILKKYYSGVKIEKTAPAVMMAQAGPDR